MLVRLGVGVVTAVATVLLVIAFPPVLVVLLLGAGVASGWWATREFRRGRAGFRSIFAAALAPTLVLAALVGAFAFAPVSGPTHGPSHAGTKLPHP
jgi:hypothetical protein